MSARARPRVLSRLPFRTQLTVLIAAVFLLGGLALLAAQYGLVAAILTSATRQTQTVSISSGTGPDAQSSVSATGVPRDAGVGVGDAATILSGLTSAVLTQVLVGSLVLVAVTAALAAVAASWLSRRTLRRVREVSDLARSISASDLSQRLALAGPADEIKQLGDTFDDMLGRLQVAFERQERFVANASHELRTPLAAERLALEGPLAQGRFGAEVESDVLRALEANRRTTRILDALLVLARSRLAPASTDAVPLDEVVADAVAAMLETASRRGLRVTQELCDGATVRGNRALLTQAIGNLLGNATIYTPTGGHVGIRLSTQGDEALLRVENDGNPYTTAEASRLTEPFHRGPETRRSSEGTGLGLALVDSVVTAHSGTLVLSPRPGGGLVVTLRLPLADAHHAEGLDAGRGAP